VCVRDERHAHTPYDMLPHRQTHDLLQF
jgi:hypothetical protein